MISVDLYFESLLARLDDAERVPFREVYLDHGIRPVRNECHDNVDAFIKSHLQFRAVRGWAVTAGCILDAHSVVCDEHGFLWDITFDSLPEPGLLFIRHRGTDEEFIGLRMQRAQHIYCGH